jgi:PEGA domain
LPSQGVSVDFHQPNDKNEELSIGELIVKQCVSILLAFSILTPSCFAQGTIASAAPTTTVAASATVTPAAPPAKHAPDGKPILEDGTPIRLRLTRALSSADCKTGDRIDFEVMDPILLDGITVVPQGGIAWGTVTDAERKKTMGRAGKLDIALVAVKLANSEKANLRAVKETKGGGHTGAMTGAMVATAIVLWPAAPLFLFMHGKDVKIPQGTEITAYVDGDKIFVPLSEASPAAVALAQPAAATSGTELTLVSTPDGADIEVDGAFVGSTPSTVTLGNGDHTVRVSKKGYQPYEKKLRTSGGKINLRADLGAV